MDYYLVLDLEMCMVKGSAKKKMHGMTQEIIQIGAVLLNKENHIIDEFSTYVKPEFGKLNDFISELTGITEDKLEEASCLRTALMKFVQWIGDRDVTVLSWSDSDYYQLIREMRVKKIKHHKIQDLLDEWLDFQKSFDDMLGLHRQYALEDAMEIGHIRPIGRMHDGLCDAYNTARILAKIQRQPAFQLSFVPIVEYAEEIEHLNFSMGKLFTPEIMAQLTQVNSEVKELPETEKEEKTNNTWSIYRRLIGWFKGADAVTDENWNKHLFQKEMKRMDFRDKVYAIFTPARVAEEM
ncbi:MAG: exonuclease domain-containing protein [Clostridia bacterium]|nr:exonuclease domain-containing protein [Lachnospiraceae bacterium]NCC00723.1 exonuclease domain-containing protein [Clostridia bacterium]